MARPSRRTDRTLFVLAAHDESRTCAMSFSGCTGISRLKSSLKKISTLTDTVASVREAVPGLNRTRPPLSTDSGDGLPHVSTISLTLQPRITSAREVHCPSSTNTCTVAKRPTRSSRSPLALDAPGRIAAMTVVPGGKQRTDRSA